MEGTTLNFEIAEEIEVSEVVPTPFSLPQPPKIKRKHKKKINENTLSSYKKKKYRLPFLKSSVYG
jgi:hypothetical protein